MSCIPSTNTMNCASIVLLISCTLLIDGKKHRTRLTKDGEMESFIVAGRQVDISSVPHQCALLVNNGFSCGCAIIHELFVLTAGHCVSNVKGKELMVMVGANQIVKNGRLNEESFTYRVRNFVRADSYYEPWPGQVRSSDICLVMVDGPIQMIPGRVQVIEVNDKFLQPGMLLYVSGYGSQERNPNNQTRPTDHPLMGTSMELKSSYDCQYSWYKRNASDYVDNTFLCALGRPEYFDPTTHSLVFQSTCGGDSGGPLVTSNGQLLVGLVSKSYRPCGSYYAPPDAFTDVAYFNQPFPNNWIVKNMNLLKKQKPYQHLIVYRPAGPKGHRTW